jgi:hypothetical protein
MWFAEQFNSFLNLGICKEYPIMAKAKAPGTKAKRTVKEQTITTNPTPVQETAQTPLEASTASAVPETKAAPAPKVNAEPRMFEVRKTETRKNLVPINIEEEIRRRAYELYQQRGPRSGGEAEDWLIAEREVMQRYHQQSA